MQSVEGLDGTKWWRKDKLFFLFLEMGHPSSALSHQSFRFLDLWTSHKIYTVGSHNSETFLIRLNFSMVFLVLQLQMAYCGTS